MRARLFAVVLVSMLVAGTARPEIAGTPDEERRSLRWDTDLLVFGDNTELFNVFREGETLLGGSITSTLVYEASPRVLTRVGFFAESRSGGEGLASFEPVIAVEIHDERSRLVIGTLDVTPRHHLVSPLRDRKLELIRPLEEGIQWIYGADRFRYDFFLNWQRLETEQRREIFDYGGTGLWSFGNAVDLIDSFTDGIRVVRDPTSSRC